MTIKERLKKLLADRQNELDQWRADNGEDDVTRAYEAQIRRIKLDILLLQTPSLP